MPHTESEALTVAKRNVQYCVFIMYFSPFDEIKKISSISGRFSKCPHSKIQKKNVPFEIKIVKLPYDESKSIECS